MHCYYGYIVFLTLLHTIIIFLWFVKFSLYLNYCRDYCTLFTYQFIYLYIYLLIILFTMQIVLFIFYVIYWYWLWLLLTIYVSIMCKKRFVVIHKNVLGNNNIITTSGIFWIFSKEQMTKILVNWHRGLCPT